jgi:hypothetical protein
MTNHNGDRRITVVVRKDIHRSLKLEAVKQETTVSDIVRGLIESWLADVRTEGPSVRPAGGGRY